MCIYTCLPATCFFFFFVRIPTSPCCFYIFGLARRQGREKPEPRQEAPTTSVGLGRISLFLSLSSRVAGVSDVFLVFLSSLPRGHYLHQGSFSNKRHAKRADNDHQRERDGHPPCEESLEELIKEMGRERLMRLDSSQLAEMARTFPPSRRTYSAYTDLHTHRHVCRRIQDRCGERSLLCRDRRRRS